MSTAEEFTVLNTEVDGLPCVAIVNARVREPNQISEMPWCLTIVTPVLFPTSLGLPEFPETDDLNKWEDVLTSQIQGSGQSIFFGRITWNGQREVIYYLSKPEPTASVLQALIDDNHQRPFSFECELDAQWEKAAFYVP